MEKSEQGSVRDDSRDLDRQLFEYFYQGREDRRNLKPLCVYHSWPDSAKEAYKQGYRTESDE